MPAGMHIYMKNRVCTLQAVSHLPNLILYEMRELGQLGGDRVGVPVVEPGVCVSVTVETGIF